MTGKKLDAEKQIDIVLYDVSEMAVALGVSPRTIMNYIKEGRLKVQKIGGKWKITRENLEAFIKGE